MAINARQMTAGACVGLLVAACADGGNQASDKGARSAPETKSVSPEPATLDADAPLIVAFGDSLYAGYGIDANEGFAPELQRQLAARGVEARVFNAGVSGDTTAAGRARLAFTLDGLPKKPALVIVGLGGNDLLRGLGPAQTRANLDAILAELKRRDIPIMLTGMRAPPNMGERFVREFDAIYADLAREYDAALYPFFFEGILEDRTKFLPDRIHPTAEGIDAVVNRVAPVVADALAKAER